MSEPLTPQLPLWQQSVTYGAVGGTKAPDLMTFPPAGFKPFERRSRIGHGESRWEFAWQQTLTWGIQTRSGFKVEVVENSGAPDGSETPEFGSRRDRQRLRTDANEVVYGSEGASSVAPGETVILTLPIGPFRVHAPCRVIWIVDSESQKGFAYGTLSGHPECGEESFVVERTPDDSVWLTVREFSRPGTWWAWAGYPITRLMQSNINNRYFRSLSGQMN